MTNDLNTHAALAALCQDYPGEHWIDPLKDGMHVLIRPLLAKDREREFQFIRHLSPKSRRLRFLGGVSTVDASLIDQLMDLDYHNRMAYVAFAHVNGQLREIGVSRYAALPESKNCECAVAVADQWQRKGLGILLMKHLIDAARRNGFQRMMSFDLSNNYAMHRLAKELGFSGHYQAGDVTETIHELDLSA